MKKRIPALLISSILAFGVAGSLTACGDNFNGITVNFWHTFGKTPLGAIEGYAKSFAKLVKENEDVNVRIKFSYKGGYGDMTGVITKAFATGDNPTIAVAYPDHVAEYFAAESKPGEYVVNLEPYMNDSEIGFGKESWLGDKYGAEDFVQSFFEEGESYAKEGVYSLPYMKSSEVMFYNMTALRKVMPEYNGMTSDVEIQSFMNDLDWETLMDLCEYVADNKSTIISKLETPCFYDSDGNFIITKMMQRNIGYASIDASGVASLDFDGIENDSTPEQISNYNKTIALLNELKGYVDDGFLTTKAVYGEYGSNQFVNQKTMFSIGSSGGAGYNLPTTKTFEVGVCKVPYDNNNPVYVTQGPTLCMLNNTKMASEDNKLCVKYGWKFLKYITNGEANADLCVNGSEGYIPVRESAYSTSTFLNFLEKGEDYAKVAKVVINDINGEYFNTPVFTGSAALREYIAGALGDTLTGKLSAKDALDNAISETVKKMA